jgi:hypothetical protein
MIISEKIMQDQQIRQQFTEALVKSGFTCERSRSQTPEKAEQKTLPAKLSPDS